jgi:hypothetical protein
LPKATPPHVFRIAAQEKKQAEEVVNLMASGPGIPWEDRGSVGVPVAFFKTAFSMMFKPVKTLKLLRRPETDRDAKLFSYVMAGIWFCSVLIQSAFNYYVFDTRDPKLDVNGQQYVINTLLEAVLAGAGAIVMTRIVSWMFYRLTAFDMVGNAPPVLAYNCIVYVTGASLLALIPGGPKSWLAIGPILAGIWMFLILLPVAIGRLRVRLGAAIIGSLLTFLGTAALVVVGMFAIHFLWCTLLDKGAVNPIVPLTNGRLQN